MEAKGGPADALFLVEILEIFENFRFYYIHSTVLHKEVFFFRFFFTFPAIYFDWCVV